ncbi:MAG: hypothetical protein JNM74_07220, partial [Myxococcales bacterium]|nr:hypothetical protein [Myxococcales bacterium]
MATTSRSLSWIDRARFGSLLDVARGGDTPQPPSVARAPAKGHEAPVTRRTLRPVMTGAAAAVPAFLPPESQLDTRLAAFLSWVVERTGCSAVFVAD